MFTALSWKLVTSFPSTSRSVNDSKDIENSDSFSVSLDDISFNEPDDLGFDLYVDQNINITFTKAGSYKVSCEASVQEPYSFQKEAIREFKIADPNEDGNGNGVESLGKNVFLLPISVFCLLSAVL